MGSHQLHPHIVQRLKRASGHLAKVIEMLEQQEDCLKIAQQLHAVLNAIGKSKTILVRQHIEDCLVDLVPGNKQRQVREFAEIAKYL